MQYDKETETMINQIDSQIKELQAKVDELKNNKKNNKRWRAKEDFNYFSLNAWLDIKTYTEKNDEFDNKRYNSGIYFKTKEEAQEHLDNLIIRQQLKDLAMELNNSEEIDWNNHDQKKYSIHLSNIGAHFEHEGLFQDWNSFTQASGTIQCLSENFLDEAIKLIGEQELINFIKAGG